MTRVTQTLDERAVAVLNVIRTRRTVRDFTEQPVSVADVRRVLEAARWASSGGNRRIHKFVVTRDPARIKLISAVSPGFSGRPTALIITCTDVEKASEELVQLDRHTTTWIDVGTAAMNMQIAAHALELGSTPVTSFSRSGVSTVMELPSTLIPELILQLGHPALGVAKQSRRPRRRLTIDDLTHWERVGGVIPNE